MVAGFLGAFAVLLVLGMPIAIVLGGAALAYLLLKGGLSLTLIVQTTYAGMASFPLLAVPLFILGGNLMTESGITRDLVKFARSLLGHVSGGLALVAIAACTIFAAISGSAVATAVAIGVMLLPAMREAGYEDAFSGALMATAACIGPVIPPSIPFILYGVITNVSIVGLFMAGVVPGLLFGVALMLYAYAFSRRRGYPRDPRPSLKDLALDTWRALPALFMPLLVVGGIVGGWFTPTEAAGVSVAYSLVVGSVVYRGLRLRRLPHILLNAALESGVVMLLLGLSEPFAWVVAVEQLPQRLLDSLMTVSASPWVILLLVNLALLLIGIPLETAPAITITASVVAPLAPLLGIDPLHLGAVVVFNLVLGLITPPVGAVLFSVCGMTKLSLERLSRAIWVPFVIGLMVLLLITYVPGLTTFLPRLVLR
ncbi:MAG: TRAP transporter large permease [Bacillota bacterium]|nr:TRAP transporter large permease [Bacillota bacterium]MDI7249485.1 TRAP transporter large permease [Bacillota bacterium]